MGIFDKSDLFNNISESIKTKIESEVVTRSFESGAFIFRQGEESNGIYVVKSGTIDISIDVQGAKPLSVKRLTEGAVLGEQSLLFATDRPRNANARALTQAEVYFINKRLFKEHLLPNETSQLIIKNTSDSIERIEKNNTLKDYLPSDNIIQLVTAQQLIEKGQTIFKKGDPSDDLYVVERGEVEVYEETSDGQLISLSRIGVGGFFGERGVLQNIPRTATVVANTNTQLIRLDGQLFKEEVRSSPKLAGLMTAFEGLYNLPRRGVVVLSSGQIDGQSTASAIYRLHDDRRIFVSRIIGSNQVLFIEEGINEEKITWLSSDKAPGIELGLVDNQLVTINAAVEWDGLSMAARVLFEKEVVTPWLQRVFSITGYLNLDTRNDHGLQDEILCGCTGKTLADISLFLGETLELDAMCEASGAGQVCGSCKPRLAELLGTDIGDPVTIEAVEELATDVFKVVLKGLLKPLPQAQCGQYVILEGFIDGAWVSRSYTLTGVIGGDEGWELGIKREDGGVFSNWLIHSGQTGLVRVSKAQGEFVSQDWKNVLCLVGGIGVTPAISIARDPHYRRLSVLHSVRRSKDAAYRSELKISCEERHGQYVLQTTSEYGHATVEQITKLINDVESEYFLVCGPKPFENSMIEILSSIGIDKSRIKVESFGVTTVQPAGTNVQKKPQLPPVCPVDHRKIEHVHVDSDISTLEQATQLLTQFHIEYGIEEALQSRLSDLVNIHEFEPTIEELTFASRVAWRNSTRCVGRIYWNGLHVRDSRHLVEPRDVLEDMAKHAKIATNEGRLRSVLTIFSPESVTGNKILSPQLARYAGYELNDGSVLGDPAHIELTQLAEQAGWVGARTPFDLLPLLVKGHDGSIQRRDFLQDEILEVPLVHPDFTWFEALNLKWHALPAISESYLDAYGVRYPVVFNGWYMGTEIGGRNLSDPYRYNLLPTIAKRMGIDMGGEAKLWRDRAMIELNVAVLYSFKRRGVTILDHHTASSEFLEFIAAEHECGRVAETDWSWVVPPISGSATPQFHMDFTNRQLKPAFVLEA